MYATLASLPREIKLNVLGFAPSLVVVSKCFFAWRDWLLTNFFCKFCTPVRLKDEGKCTTCGWTKRLNCKELDRIRDKHEKRIWKRRRRTTRVSLFFA